MEIKLEKKEITEEKYVSSNGRYILLIIENGTIKHRYFGIIGENYETKQEINASDMHRCRQLLME